MTTQNAHTEAVQWILEVFLPKQYGKSFRPKKLLLQSRGNASFEAVSDDEEIVAMISTSSGLLANGKVDTGALMKIRSDALKILWLEHTPSKRFIILTNPSMSRVIREEIKKGHFPKETELLRVKLPAAIEAKIEGERTGGAQESSSKGDADQEPAPKRPM
jgi:hypothetical protein